MTKGIKKKDKQNGRGFRIGIIRTTWNDEIVSELHTRCLHALRDAGVRTVDSISIEVPGAFELPLAAQYLIKKKKVDAVVALGCLIKGETMHFEYICDSVSHGLQRVALDTGRPVVFGVLCCLTEVQAKARASRERKDHGYEWGQTAVEMVRVLKGGK